MKKFIILATAVTCMFSCKSKDEKLKEQMLPVVRKIVADDSLVTTIDSIVIWKIDTLTDLNIELRKTIKLEAQISYYKLMGESFSNTAQLYTSQMRLSSSNISLYAGVLHSQALVDAEKNSFDDYKEKALAELKKSQLYSDSMTIALNRIKDIDKRRAERKIDSISFRGYIAHFRVKGADKKNVQVKLDSMYVYLSENMRIINPTL